MFLENAETFEYTVTDAGIIFASEGYLRDIAVAEGYVKVGSDGVDWDEVADFCKKLGFKDVGIFLEKDNENGAVVHMVNDKDLYPYYRITYFNVSGLSGDKLRDMAIDCYHIAPGFESRDIYYYPMFMYDDLMDDFTPLEQAYMDRSNFDAHTDEYFILTENNNVLIGLTDEEYVKHLREHERTIVDYYTSFVK